MLKKSQSEKTPKVSLKERIIFILDDASASMTKFKEESGKSFLKWSFVYTIIAFLSLFIFNADEKLDLIEYPFVLALLAPRMMTLFLFTCPVLKMKKRKKSLTNFVEKFLMNSIVTKI